MANFIIRSLRTLEIISLLSFLAFIPSVALITHWLGDKAFLPVGLIWMGWWLYLGFRLTTWKCPRCNQDFLRKSSHGIVVPFRERCAHCGLYRAELGRYSPTIRNR